MAKTKHPSSDAVVGVNLYHAMICHQQDKKEKDVDGLGKRRKTSQSEDVSICDSRAAQML